MLRLNTVSLTVSNYVKILIQPTPVDKLQPLHAMRL